jgi:hypothetical protein
MDVRASVFEQSLRSSQLRLERKPMAMNRRDALKNLALSATGLAAIGGSAVVGSTDPDAFKIEPWPVKFEPLQVDGNLDDLDKKYRDLETEILRGQFVPIEKLLPEDRFPVYRMEYWPSAQMTLNQASINRIYLWSELSRTIHLRAFNYSRPVSQPVSWRHPIKLGCEAVLGREHHRRFLQQCSVLSQLDNGLQITLHVSDDVNNKHDIFDFTNVVLTSLSEKKQHSQFPVSVFTFTLETAREGTRGVFSESGPSCYPLSINNHSV